MDRWIYKLYSRSCKYGVNSLPFDSASRFGLRDPGVECCPWQVPGCISEHQRRTRSALSVDQGSQPASMITCHVALRAERSLEQDGLAGISTNKTKVEVVQATGECDPKMPTRQLAKEAGMMSLRPRDITRTVSKQQSPTLGEYYYGYLLLR
jgi:hypothetical protein